MDESQVNDHIYVNSADAMSYALEIAGVGARSYAFVLDWHIRLLAALVWIYLSAFIFYDLSIFSTMFEDDFSARLYRIFFLSPDPGNGHARQYPGQAYGRCAPDYT